MFRCPALLNVLCMSNRAFPILDSVVVFPSKNCSTFGATPGYKYVDEWEFVHVGDVRQVQTLLPGRFISQTWCMALLESVSIGLMSNQGGIKVLVDLKPGPKTGHESITPVSRPASQWTLENGRIINHLGINGIHVGPTPLPLGHSLPSQWEYLSIQPLSATARGACENRHKVKLSHSFKSRGLLDMGAWIYWNDTWWSQGYLIFSSYFISLFKWRLKAWFYQRPQFRRRDSNGIASHFPGPCIVPQRVW